MDAVRERDAALAEYAMLEVIGRTGSSGGAELDRLAKSCERCARAFLECAKNLRNNADEARENNAP